MSVQKNETAKPRRTNKRQAFLDAARGIFARKGFQATNVTDIVTEVESGQGTFYYHFKDKEAIFDELMMSFLDELTAVLVRNEVRAQGRLALASRELAIENARELAGVYMDNFDLAELFFKESKYIGGKAMERIEAFYKLLYNQIEDGLEKGKKAGLVRPDLDTRIGARCFVGAAEKAVYEAVKAGGDVDLDRIAVQIVDFQSLGVLARE